MDTKPLIWIFAGTSEGRELIRLLAAWQVEIIASVATSYGELLLTPQKNLQIMCGRQDYLQIAKFIQEKKPSCVIDATHPYAVAVTGNLKAACMDYGARYLRLLRQKSNTEGCMLMPGYLEAVEYLNGTEGNIVLTTGSNHLEEFTRIRNFNERVFLRMLPFPSSLEKALGLGFKPGNVICIQGPFTEELNRALFRYACAKYVVSKESGPNGGFGAKKKAAESMGASLIVIERTEEKDGTDLLGVLNELERQGLA